MLIRKVVIGASLILLSSNAFAGKFGVLFGGGSGTGSINTAQSIIDALSSGTLFSLPAMPGLFERAAALPGSVVSNGICTTAVLTAPDGTKFTLDIDETGKIVGLKVLS